MLTFDMSANWRDLPIAAVDTETTGLDAATQRIVEVAVVRFEKGQVAERWATLLDPGRPMPKEASDISGITDAMLAGKPTFRAAKWDVWGRLRDRVFLAFNADFDWRFVEAELRRAGLTPPPVPVLDPLVWARQLLPGERSHKLGALCEKLGIPLESAHRAEQDAEAAARLALRLADKLPVTLGELLREQAAWRQQQNAAYAARKAAKAARGAPPPGPAQPAVDPGQGGLFRV